MENSWIEEFYKETDADKRLELLENNSTDMDGDSAGSSTVFRQRLWTARYGKRKPKNDAFVGCLMELKYISEGGSVDIGGQKKETGCGDHKQALSVRRRQKKCRGTGDTAI